MLYHRPSPLAAKNYYDGSFHEPLSVISYHLAHLRPHLQPCTECGQLFLFLPFSSFIRFLDSVLYLFEFRLPFCAILVRKMLSFLSP